MALGYVKTVNSMPYVCVGEPLFLRVSTQTRALSLDAEVTHDQPKSTQIYVNCQTKLETDGKKALKVPSEKLTLVVRRIGLPKLACLPKIVNCV